MTRCRRRVNSFFLLLWLDFSMDGQYPLAARVLQEKGPANAQVARLDRIGHRYPRNNILLNEHNVIFIQFIFGGR